MKTILFFNNKGGVGKTTLAYHLTWMLAEMGHRCLAIDLDPQANLSASLLQAEELERIYTPENDRETILAGIKLLNKGIGDIQPVKIHDISQNIGLLAGDLELSMFEDKLSDSWGKCLNKDEYAFRITSAIYRIIQEAGKRYKADYCLLDAGPNFGDINRTTLIAADYLIIPAAADLFSLQGLKNVGNRLETWKSEWNDRKVRNPEPDLMLPPGDIVPLGYVVMQHGIKESRPVKSYRAWADRIPDVFSEYVKKNNIFSSVSIEQDENCLALLKHYHSLIPMSMETHKPIFLLKPADGAIGAHLGAVKRSYQDFETLAQKIIQLIANS